MIVTIYTFINDILYKKNGKCLDKKENEAELKPYLMQRWTSMYNSKGKYSLVKYINATTNRMYRAFDDKQSWYWAMLSVIPKMKYEKLSYIKKKPVEKDPVKNIDDVIEFLAKQHNLSKREVRLYIEEYGVNIDAVKRSIRS